jgi:hypothetical protein
MGLNKKRLGRATRPMERFISSRDTTEIRYSSKVGEQHTPQTRMKVPSLKRSALIAYRDHCIQRGDDVAARVIDEAIRLTSKGDARSAIKLLVKHSIFPKSDWVNSDRAWLRILTEFETIPYRSVNSVRPARECPRCHETVPSGELIRHNCFPAEKPARVKKRSSLPRKQRYVKVKSHFKGKLSDISGGNY